jgi:hypothetical protein
MRLQGLGTEATRASRNFFLNRCIAEVKRTLRFQAQEPLPPRFASHSWFCRGDLKRVCGWHGRFFRGAYWSPFPATNNRPSFCV